MTQQEITLLNLGSSLDDLSNLDPRGYGVCKLLYKASREYTGEPLCVNSAKKLAETIKEGDLVYIMTGFVLLPFKKAEMDGIVSSVLLARALVKAFGAKPVLVVPQDCVHAVEQVAPVAGLHLYHSVEEALAMPFSVGMEVFTKNAEEAEACADAILAKGRPAACIAIEAPGANELGQYHNAVGKNTTAIEAKSDILFVKCQQLGV